MNEEDELQAELGGVAPKVRWVMRPQRWQQDHVAGVHLAENYDGSVVICSCGWTYLFPSSAKLTDCESIFLEHVG